MTSIPYYPRVADLYAALGRPFEQAAGFSIDDLLELHPEIPYTSPVFRTDYYSFIFVSGGRGNYTTDARTFDYGDRTIYFTNPGHLKAFTFHELSSAYLVTADEAFLKEFCRADLFRAFPFLLAETVPPLTLAPEPFAEIERLYHEMARVYAGDSAYRYQMIGHLLSVLLFRIKEAFWEDYAPLEEGDRGSEIVRRFKADLEAHHRDLAGGQAEVHFQAQDYASAQHLSAGYFGEVISSKTGKPVSRWLSEKTVSQAQAYLRNSSLSVKEIADKLRFTDTAHFSNFYKKHTGETASGYRRAQRLG